MPSLTKQDYRDALRNHGDSNLLRVLEAFHSVIPKIACDCDGLNDIARHPISTLYAERIGILCSADYKNHADCAELECRNMAGEDAEI